MDLKKLPRLFSEEESKQLDEKSQTEGGWQERELMSMAAHSLLQENYSLFREASSVVLLCGKGGNGGDGLALALLLWQETKEILVYAQEPAIGSTARIYWERAKKSDLPLFPLEEFVSTTLLQGTVIVDCLLGTGFRPPLSSLFQQVMTKLEANQEKLFVISVDVPSGSGADSPVFVKPQKIQELGTRKWTNRNFPFLEISKTFTPLGFPQGSPSFPAAYLWPRCSFHEIQEALKRHPGENKYTSGSAVFVGGSEGMSGAIYLSQDAFQSFGGGISKTFTPTASSAKWIWEKDPSLMVASFSQWEEIASDPFTSKAKVTVIGPGMGGESNPKGFSWELVHSERILLDAGAISWVPNTAPPNKEILLTPHTGEFARLVGKKETELYPLVCLAREFTISHQVNILLKGPISLLVLKDQTCFAWERPNPKLATMGTGDLLAGTIACFWSKGHPLEKSVHYALSLFSFTEEMSLAFPSAREILGYLKERL